MAESSPKCVPQLTLGAKQRLMTRLLPKLLDHIHASGYECTLGDAFRDSRVHGKVGEKAAYGAAYSMHKSRCAIDLNLFKDGVYLRETKDYVFAGEFWENLHPLTASGIRFNDGNHFSITHDGRK